MTLGWALDGTDQHSLLDATDEDIDNYRSAFAHLLQAGRVNGAARAILGLGVY